MKTSVSWVCLIVLLLLQSISAPGSGIWSDGKDKSEGAQAHTWNVEVLIDVLKELVSKYDPGFVLILTLCTQDFCCLFYKFCGHLNKTSNVLEYLHLLVQNRMKHS